MERDSKAPSKLVHLPVHGKGPSILDINWFFAAPKLKKLKCSFWKNILGSWLNVRVGLAKSEPASHAEVLTTHFQQPSHPQHDWSPFGSEWLQ
jgi:hypothetical protein